MSDFSKTLVVGISSRSLFGLERENDIFEKKGLAAYRDYQIKHENQPPEKGTAFYLVERLLILNQSSKNKGKSPLVEVVLMSRNDASIGIRLFNAIEAYNLKITRAAFTGGTPLSDYLAAFQVDLFLSKYEDDVGNALAAKVAAAIIREPPAEYEPARDKIRIAFDGDAVIFTDEAEQIYQKQGIEAFAKHEKRKSREPLAEGPFGKLFKLIVKIQQSFPPEKCPIRLALVTSRGTPVQERVIRTLRAWNVSINESFFLDGKPKDAVLKAFRPHIFFDDQKKHIEPAAGVVPAGHVQQERRGIMGKSK